MLLALFLTLSAAVLAIPLHRLLGRHATWLLVLVPGGITFWLLGELYAGALPRYEVWAWMPALEVELAMKLDGLGGLMSLLIAGIGSLILLYAHGYMAHDDRLPRLHAYLLLFMAAMLGVVWADHMLALFVFWELTSLSSYLLIGFNHQQETARKSALQALLITGTGGLALLVGLVLLGQAAGTWRISAIAVGAVTGHPWYGAIVLLVALGAFTKSAQFPFHFWLPGAMAAPTPVSAYLHSATMVKAGVYLLARLTPVLAGTALWTGILVPVGALTMVVGSVYALTQTDLKRILAYTTVSSLGMMVMLLGVGSPLALWAVPVVILAHGCYKGALFMVAGNLDHEAGTRDVTRLGGLAKKLPFTFIAALLAVISAVGLFPMLGFTAKELLIETVWQLTTGKWWLLTAVSMTALASVVALGLAGLRPFVARHSDLPKHPHEAPWTMWIGPCILGGCSLGLGLSLPLITTMLLAPAGAAIAGGPLPGTLKLWHGFTPVLMLSLALVALGVVGLVFWWSRVGAAQRRVVRWEPYTPQAGYDAIFSGSMTLARQVTQRVQNGKLRVYIAVIMATMVAMAGMVFLPWWFSQPLVWLGDMTVFDGAICGLVVSSAVAACVLKSRIGALISLSVVGLGIMLLFAIFGAPDLALTQVMVETLTIILLVLVLKKLPQFTDYGTRLGRGRDAVIAGGVGLIMAGLVLMAGPVRLTPESAEYYAAHSLPEAQGKNIVNVILVDFRGFDTLGEITVVAVAGLGVYALMRRRGRTP